MRGLRLAVAGVLAAAVVLPVAPAAAISPAVAPAVEPASPAQPATLTFASFNICKVNCGDEAGFPWSLRRERVARVIATSDADVIGLQEATNNSTKWAKRQVDDVEQLIAPAGYEKVSFPLSVNACRRPRSSSGKLAGPSPCDNTSALFYRSSTIQQATLPSGGASAGIVQLGDIAPGQDARSASRSVMWSYLQPRSGGTPFLAIALHTDSAKDDVAEASRVAVGRGLTGWVAAMNNLAGLPGAPAVLMADLNSFAKRQPQGAQRQLTDTGWVDAFSAPQRANVRYSTVNHSATYGLTGFPSAPRVQKITKRNPLGEAPRIDYVMGLGAAPVSYETVMHLTGRAFNPDFQASDHQMVKAVMTLG